MMKPLASDLAEGSGPSLRPWSLVYMTLVLWVVLDRFIPDLYVLPVGIDLGPSEAVLIGLIVSLVVALATSPRRWPRGLAPLSGTLVVTFVILAAFLASSNLNQYQAAGARRGVFMIVVYAALFLGGYFIAQTDRWAIGILRAIVVMSVWQAILTIVEWRAGAAVTIQWPIWKMIGLATAAVVRGDQFRTSGLFRPQGAAAHPIVASALAALAVLIIVALLTEETKSRFRLWLFVALPPVLLSVFLVNARTGFVILVVGALTIAILKARWLPRFLPLAAVGLIGIGVAGVLAPNSLRSSLNLFWSASEDSSVIERIDRLAAVPELVGQNPIFGPGWLTNDPGVLLWDNTWILSLIELGIVGTAAIIVFLMSTMGRMWTARRYATPVESVLMMCGITAGAVLIISGFTFDAFAFNQFLPATILLMGMGLAGADRAVRRSNDGGSTQRAPLEATTEQKP